MNSIYHTKELQLGNYYVPYKCEDTSLRMPPILFGDFLFFIISYTLTLSLAALKRVALFYL